MFSNFSKFMSVKLGQPISFICALLVIILWLITGPFFDYSNTWQLVVNTGTSVVTFLMIFLVQNTQNRETKVIQLKLDEIIRANSNTSNKFLKISELPDEELDQLLLHYESLAEEIKKSRSKRKKSNASAPEEAKNSETEISNQ